MTKRDILNYVRSERDRLRRMWNMPDHPNHEVHETEYLLLDRIYRHFTSNIEEEWGVKIER